MGLERGARWSLLSVGCAGALVAGIALAPVLTESGGSDAPRRGVSITPLAPAPAIQEAPAEAPAEASGEASAAASPRRSKVPSAPQVDEAWVTRTAEAVGIPVPAMRAYGRAVLGASRGCQLGWTTLAGIGWVESQHGTIDGRTLGDDGRADSPVVGPALDGSEGLAAIRATRSSTVLHGDPVWDRAVGPMQFIPSTWRRWARDGDGDGVADPHDIDDAAVSAAAYLCHDSRDLTTSRGWNAAIFSYNHDTGYVVAVHAAANRYGQLAQG